MSQIKSIYDKKIQERLLESVAVKQKVAKNCLEPISQAVQLIIESLQSGGKVMICGNGGSAADSQHMAAELVCGLNKQFNSKGLAAIALTTDTSILTAYSNDVGFQKVFKRQLEALGKPGDVLVAISTSGNSLSILTATKYAKTAKIHTIALTGQNGKLENLADVSIIVPSTNTQYIQESHLSIEHIICELVEEHFNKK